MSIIPEHYERFTHWPWRIGPYTGFTLADAARVWLVPIEIRNRETLDRILLIINTSAGNIIVGIYEDNGDIPDGGALIVESASIASPGTGRRLLTIANTQLRPGLYWFAVESDTTTLDITRCSSTNQAGDPPSIRSYDRGGGYGALTDPCPATTGRSVGPSAIAGRIVSMP